MAFHRGFSTLGCPDASIEDCRQIALRHGLEALELRALGGSVDLLAHLESTYGSPADLASEWKRAADPRRPIGIVSLNTSFRLLGSQAADRAALLRFVPWAEALEIPWLRVFDGGSRGDAAEIAEAVETLRWWQGERERGRWRADIMVETHDSLFTADAISRFCEAAPGGWILWDAHHTWRKGGEDPMATWRAIRTRVVHVHIKDSIAVPSARHPYTYVLPGDGAFPAGPILAQLKEEFAHVVSLEWEKLWHPALPPLETALAVAADRHWW